MTNYKWNKYSQMDKNLYKFSQINPYKMTQNLSIYNKYLKIQYQHLYRFNKINKIKHKIYKFNKSNNIKMK